MYFGIMLILVSCGSNESSMNKLTKENKKLKLEIAEMSKKNLDLETELKMELEAKRELETDLKAIEAQRKEEINSFKTVKIGNLEVMAEDIEGTIHWYQASKVCADLGDGWRLPTKEELNTLYKNKDKIGGFVNSYYWSSTAYDSNKAFEQNFLNGSQNVGLKVNGGYARAVRAF